MTRKSYSGNAPSTTLASGINNSTLTIPVVSGTGYPDGTGGPFWIVIDPGLSSEEKILCDSTSGNTITANASGRGGDDTTAATHANGAVVQHVFTAEDADEANAHVNTTALDQHTQYYNSARLLTAHDVEARHTFGAAYGTPATPAALAATGSAGSGDNPAREDHVHPIGTYSDFAGVTVKQGSTTFTVDKTARYCQIGKMVHYYGSATVTAGSGVAFGEIDILLPVNAASTNAAGGTGLILNVGADFAYTGAWAFQVTRLRAQSPFLANVAADLGPEALDDIRVFSHPLGIDDYFEWNVTYEAA